MPTPEFSLNTPKSRLSKVIEGIASLFRGRPQVIEIGAYTAEHEPGTTYVGFDEVPSVSLGFTDAQRDRFLAGLRPAIEAVYRSSASASTSADQENQSGR